MVGLAFPLFALLALAVPFVAARSDRSARALAYGLWGLTTTLFFAPMGALLALVLFDHALVSAAATALVSLLGFVVGVMSMMHARRVGSGATREGTTVGWLNIAHHALVLGVLGAVIIAQGAAQPIAVLVALAIPCLSGGYVGYRMLTADRVTG